MMKLIDDIDREENESLPEEREDDIFFSLLQGKTVEDVIKTSRGEFTVKYPKQKDVLAIGRVAAYMRSGIPAAQFDTGADYEIQKCATLDVVVTAGPGWFEQAKKKDKNFSWRNVPDVQFIDELYAKALQFRGEVQKKFGENKEAAAEEDDGEVSVGVPADVGDGVFSGVAVSPEKRKR